VLVWGVGPTCVAERRPRDRVGAAWGVRARSARQFRGALLGRDDHAASRARIVIIPTLPPPPDPLDILPVWSSLLLSALVAQTPAVEPSVVAVFAIEGKDAKVSARSLDVLTDLLAASLGASPRFRIVPREEVKARLSAAKADSYKACVDQACQIEIGKELAAQKTLASKVLRLGDRCVLAANLVDLRTAVTERSATVESACTDVALMGAVKAVAAQLGAPATDGPAAGASAASDKPADKPLERPKVEPTPSGRIADFASWEILDGTWYADETSFYGTNGHLSLRTPTPKNYRFAITVEQVAGHPNSTMGIGVRTILIPGKTLRGRTIDLQCYGFNHAATGVWSVFRGAGGNWFRVNPTEWPSSPHIRPGPRRVEWLVRGADFTISVDGKEVFRFKDASLPVGGPVVAVHHVDNTYRFSQPELVPLD
jgi:hypothetical protein